MYCLWPLQCILFVATPTIVSTIIMLVCNIIVRVVVLASAQTCTGFVIVLWVQLLGSVVCLGSVPGQTTLIRASDISVL